LAKGIKQNAEEPVGREIEVAGSTQLLEPNRDHFRLVLEPVKEEPKWRAISTRPGGDDLAAMNHQAENQADHFEGMDGTSQM
jgi:hypothetical protein